MLVLQWGRANDGAEIYKEDVTFECGVWLQWGRANDGAEMAKRLCA